MSDQSINDLFEKVGRLLQGMAVIQQNQEQIKERLLRLEQEYYRATGRKGVLVAVWTIFTAAITLVMSSFGTIIAHLRAWFQ